MVLNKWAAVTKSAPPAAGLRPLARTVLQHPKLVPAGYKTPFVIRPFIKDWHRNALQHIEIRGMYKEELSIERSRFPRMQKTFVIQTDGSLNEREMEFAVPPVMLLYQDRLTAYRQRQAALAKIGQRSVSKPWELKPTRSETSDQGEEDEDEEKTSSASDRLMCNALEFPYCVPKKLRVRAPVPDPLRSKSGLRSRND